MVHRSSSVLGRARGLGSVSCDDACRRFVGSNGVCVYACVGQGMHTTMALRRKNASFSAHKEPLSGTQQQASHKEAEVFVAVVQRWRDG
jgi:hypothetical protein